MTFSTGEMVEVERAWEVSDRVEGECEEGDPLDGSYEWLEHVCKNGQWVIKCSVNENEWLVY